MRRMSPPLLASFAIALTLPGVARAGQYLQLGSIDGGSEGARACRTAAGNTSGGSNGGGNSGGHGHENGGWIPILSTGSDVTRRASNGIPGRLTILIDDARSALALEAIADCGRPLNLTLRDEDRLYRLREVRIRTHAGELRTQGGSPARPAAFTLTYESLRRAN